MSVDILTYALSKKFTEKSMVGLGAVQGAPCTIKSIEPVDGGQKVTFEWTGTDGSSQNDSLIVPSSAIHIGSEPPTDPTVSVWIDPDSELPKKTWTLLWDKTFTEDDGPCDMVIDHDSRGNEFDLEAVKVCLVADSGNNQVWSILPYCGDHCLMTNNIPYGADANITLAGGIQQEPDAYGGWSREFSRMFNSVEHGANTYKVITPHYSVSDYPSVTSIRLWCHQDDDSTVTHPGMRVQIFGVPRQ